MAGKKVDAYVACPYYKNDGEDKRMIRCEGVQEGTAIHLAFASTEEVKKYKACFCKRDYNKCILAQMQNRRYEYDVQN